MATYWDSFLEKFPWVNQLALNEILELFWYYCQEGEVNKKTFQRVLDGCIQKLKDSEEISENTLKMIDTAMENFAKGIVSDPIDLDEFPELLEDED